MMKGNHNVKKIINWSFLAFGMLLLLGGLVLYGLGTQDLLPVDRPRMLFRILALPGIFLIVSGACELFFKKTKAMEIEEKDERNVRIANEAKALAYEVMTTLLSLVLAFMALTGYLTVAVFFVFFAVFAITQITFVTRLWYLQKNR